MASPIPSCGHITKDSWMYAHSQCHVDSPTWVRIKGNTLVIECSDCRKVVATFLLQE